ncbi:chorismate mutase [Gardnerella vaginalis]|uniref:Chorismate mutase n=1 Tax=Gardnerella vaginalis TaxID=2702 RepID=A0A133NPA2_GARVA|nr:chorismate mutase [Gardnerella vaginalis]KXA18107.1 chorismate mutase [Gardnerella vaginalis]
MCNSSKESIDARKRLTESDCSYDCDSVSEIFALRQSIDNIDNAIVALLAERFKVTEKVGEIKARANLATEDKSRENRQASRLKKIAEESGLKEEIALEYLHFVVTAAKKRHQEIKDNQK